ncbi:hypothetical protein GOODEAATRI_031615 [Goodea atripinnis]|uniref:exo-alpha-sialidase n=1 Tax=Goodea atripinnis TaxID=208336 RepID=A0ABV0NRD3_9TELE
MAKLLSDKVPQIIFKPIIYRIPVLLNVEDTLTFAEQKREKADHTVEKLVMKKGMLNKEVDKVTAKWTEQRVVEEAHKEGHRTMNPCPVYDRENRKLFLFFICVEGSCTEWWQIDNYCNKTRFCYITSEDLGETCSELTDLTQYLPEHCVTFAVGPGHGLQTKDTRLIVPVYSYIGVKPVKPVPHAVSL